MDGDFLNPSALDRADKLARRAVLLDPNLPQARAQFGMVLTWRRQHDASMAEFERAMALNPNFADWRSHAMALVCAGEPAKAIAVTELRMPLDPYYPPFATAWFGLAHYMLKRYAKALPPLRECVSRGPNYRHGRVCLTITLAQLGRLDGARAEAAEVLRIEPNYTIDGTQRRLSFFKRPEDSDTSLTVCARQVCRKSSIQPFARLRTCSLSKVLGERRLGVIHVEALEFAIRSRRT